jgi:hypothetical protein
MHWHTTNKSAPESHKNPTKNMESTESVQFIEECYTFWYKKDPNAVQNFGGGRGVKK